MTLIITIAAYNRIVQASDRRLTRLDGNLVDDEANKAVCVSCKDACFAIAYTGLAEIGIQRTRTDEWLVGFLTSIDAAGKKVIEISEALKDRVLSLEPAFGWRKLTFRLAGFWDGRPFAVCVSNCRGSHLFLMKPHIKRKKANVVFLDGEVGAVGRAIHQQVKKLRRQRFVQVAKSDVVAKKLVSLIRAAARTTVFGESIGRNCMTVVITPRKDFPENCNLRTQYHLDKGSPVGYAPHFVTYTGTFSNIEFGAPGSF